MRRLIRPTPQASQSPLTDYDTLEVLLLCVMSPLSSLKLPYVKNETNPNADSNVLNVSAVRPCAQLDS